MLRDDLLVGAQAAADYTGLPRQMIYRMVRAGELSCTKKGSLLFFRKSDLDRDFCSETADA